MAIKIDKVKEWYETNETRISAASLLFGFVFDSLTLQRIDAWRENLYMILMLLLVGVSIVFLNIQEKEGVEKASQAKKHFWFFNLLQFGFGALLGTFFIFYFRSATLISSWPFLLILLLAMVANELFQKRYARLTFQISFFYLCLYSFAIFLVPILTKRIGADMFIVSGLVSLLALWAFILILKKFAHEKFKDSKVILTRSIAVIFISINILYFTNIIPPVPLSLKDGGVYHSVTKTSDGSYVTKGEGKSLAEYFRGETVHYIQGEPLYVYTAVFSPTKLNTRIVHEWQYKDEVTGEWITATKIPLSVSGGRGNGFRTFSLKSSLTPGRWRVNVSTPRGQLIGRVSFKIMSSDSLPDLVTETKE